MRAALAMAPHLVPLVFGDSEIARLTSVLDVDPSRAITDIAELSPAERGDLQLLITGWGAPRVGPGELDALPALRAIVHWGGGVGFIDSSATERGVVVSTGRTANAVPVAEWTVAMIVLAAKEALWVSRRYCAERRAVDREAELAAAGLHRTVVGIVGASSVGSLVMEKLKSYDVQVLLFDPWVNAEHAAALGARLVDDLTDLARRCRILSIHAPELPETRGMISRDVLAALPDDATVINTARGALVDQEALVKELSAGRLRAVLDVTEPEVPAPDSPLYSLPNVFLTPHLAGSVGSELRRLGEAATAEVENFVAGRTFAHPIVP